MQQVPTDSIFQPARADEQASSADEQASPSSHFPARPKEKSVRQVIQELPDDATPEQQDSAVQAHFRVAELSFPEGKTYAFPLEGGPATRCSVPRIELFEARLTKGTRWEQHSIVPSQQGIAGDPLPYRFRTDDYVTAALLLSFFLMTWSVARSWRYLTTWFRDFFYAPRSDNRSAERDKTELRGRPLLIFQTCFLLGILFFDYTQERLPEVFNQASPYVILCFAVGACSLYFLCKIGLYRFVNYVFFERRRAEEWMETYQLSILLEGLALLPVTLLLVYFDLSYEWLKISFACVICGIKLLLLYKCMRLFFSSFLGCVHLILYFCTLEILPVALLWRALVFSSHYLAIIT